MRLIPETLCIGAQSVWSLPSFFVFLSLPLCCLCVHPSIFSPSLQFFFHFFSLTASLSLILFPFSPLFSPSLSPPSPPPPPSILNPSGSPYSNKGMDHLHCMKMKKMVPVYDLLLEMLDAHIMHSSRLPIPVAQEGPAPHQYQHQHQHQHPHPRDSPRTLQTPLSCPRTPWPQPGGGDYREPLEFGRSWLVS